MRFRDDLPEDIVARSLPVLLFAALACATWNTWFMPFQDHGREVGTAIRVARGEMLYRDVAYLFGPWPPLLDALVLRIAGERLQALVVLRLFVSFAGLLTLASLIRRIAPDRVVTTAGLVLAVASCAVRPSGGSWLFPYSIAALEGLVLMWLAIDRALAASGGWGSLAAGVLAGLAAGTKIEFVPIAICATFLVLASRRPPRESLVSLGIASALTALAWGGPILLFGPESLRAGGYLVALDVPPAFQRLQEELLWGGDPGRGFAAMLGELILPSGLLLASGTLLAWGPGAGRLRLLTSSLLGLFAGLLLPGPQSLHAFVPVAILLGLVDIIRGVRLGPRRGPVDLVRAAMGIVVIGTAWRQPLFNSHASYGTVTTPTALAYATARIGAIVGSPAVLGGFVGGLALPRAAEAVVRTWDLPRRKVKLPRGTLVLAEPEAVLLEDLVRLAIETTPAGSFVAGFPEPGMVHFLSGRRNPFRDEQFYPGCITPESEAGLLRSLARNRPGAGFLLDRDMHEFRVRGAGDGTIPRLFEGVYETLQPSLRIGPPWGTFVRDAAKARTALWLVPREPLPSLVRPSPDVRWIVLRYLEELGDVESLRLTIRAKRWSSAASGAAEETSNGKPKR